jgi:hypothetical protein
VDGPYYPPSMHRVTTVVDGDQTFMSIAAASILAKVARDAYIVSLCDQHPDLDAWYDLRCNKGYGTKPHMGHPNTLHHPVAPTVVPPVQDDQTARHRAVNDGSRCGVLGRRTRHENTGSTCPGCSTTILVCGPSHAYPPTQSFVFGR